MGAILKWLRGLFRKQLDGSDVVRRFESYLLRLGYVQLEEQALIIKVVGSYPLS